MAAELAVAVPHAVVVALTAAGPAWWWFRVRRQRRRGREGRCLRCGYNLRESHGKCPECGEVAGAASSQGNGRTDV
jgi:hypothetical protein